MEVISLERVSKSSTGAKLFMRVCYMAESGFSHACRCVEDNSGDHCGTYRDVGVIFMKNMLKAFSSYVCLVPFQ